ncbi:MAG: peptidoglycan DD-metalloendopeptidase family protein [Oscillospiraceae bacterium]|nr:peptidoglycan DD-metalloendopeptidase family protein [Oscillospiraceae bacterium]
MESLEQRPGRNSHRARSMQSRRSGKMERREKKRLMQLFSCIFLFAIVFFGKQFLPWDETVIGQAVSSALGQTIDFKAAFSALGESISDGEPLAAALNQVYLAVFHPEKMKEESVSLHGLAAAEVEFLSKTFEKGAEAAAQHQLNLQRKGTEKAEITSGAQATTAVSVPSPGTGTEMTIEKSSAPTATAEPSPAVTPAPTPVPSPVEKENPSPQGIAEVNDAGQALPEKTSMKKAALTFSYITPVSGNASSEFGYRSHPVDGEYKFHYGLDIAAAQGAEIKAFADGTVDYVGQSAAYGNYTRLSHAGGITSFYAHCSKVLVKKGQTVKKGDLIALVGDTGNATGPHLHLEIKKDGVFLNPHYYVDVQ